MSLSPSSRDVLRVGLKQVRQLRDAADVLRAAEYEAQARPLREQAFIALVELSEQAGVENDLHVQAEAHALDRRTYDGLARDHARLEDLLAGLLRTPLWRWLRWGQWPLLLTALVTAIVVWWVSRPPYDVHASAAFSARHVAHRAVDGSKKKEWLLPDGTAGWLDVEFSEPTQVQRLTIHNAQNLNWRDRSARRVVVTLFSGDAQRGRHVLKFRNSEGARESISLEPAAGPIDRVRFAVKTWYGLGGGLAEIEIEAAE